MQLSMTECDKVLLELKLYGGMRGLGYVSATVKREIPMIPMDYSV